MLIADLSVVESRGFRFFAVGWLSSETHIGQPSCGDLQKLKSLLIQSDRLAIVIDRYRSCRTCPVCGDFKSVQSDSTPLGFRNLILQASIKDSYWFFPDLIVHHIEFHGYKVPHDFSVALEQEPQPVLDIANIKAAIAPFWLEQRGFSPRPHGFP